MGPSRKRPRTNAPPPKDESSGSATPHSAADELRNLASLTPLPENPSDVTSTDPLDGASALLKARKPDSTIKVNPKSSWYGSWPRKSTASTQIARETILADKAASSSTPSDTHRVEQSKPSSALNRPASMRLGKGKETLDLTMGGTSEGTNALNTSVAAPSREHRTSEGSKAQSNTQADGGVPKVDGTEQTPVRAPNDKQEILQEAQTVKNTPQRPTTSSGWLGGWLIRPVEQASKDITEPSNLTQVEEPVVKEVEASTSSSTAPVPPPEDAKPTDPTSNTTSWFGLWSKAAPSAVEKPPEKPQIPVPISISAKDVAPEDSMSPPSSKPTAGSSWAFWSTDNRKAQDPMEKPNESQGELATVGEPSETKPEPAKTIIVKDDKKSKTAKRSKTGPTEDDTAAQKAGQLETASIKTTSSQSPAPTKTQPPNLLIPSVKSTYRLVENPSILQQIARLLLKGKQAPVKHVFLSKDVPKIKHALAIGIHGLFPAPLLRTVIGQPTGTSIKFANHAAEAIRRWTDSHGSVSCEIEKVALEGEGKIADRVDNLWKLLLNWIEHVRKADFILIGCHSQGVPVAIMLVAKLIEFGVVSSARIGVCAMAGVSLGPFSDYKSRLFSGSAGELFDFANAESTVSKRYEDSLKVALKYGTRITYCGSIDDQLVSMESSIFSTVSHPYIFRAVFVDGRIHAPDFLSHLVGFALKLRNLGVSDHGLIRELSAPLAGSLYTGEGHSRLYDDGKVYDLATEFALGTTSIGDIPLQVQKYEIPTNANPYVLPWIMRGLLEEDFVKTELDAETTELLKQFDDWKPSTKVLKDVKYRLEAVRSKL